MHASNNKLFLVGEDPWASFGKAPSSISPDADDLLQMRKMDSGSAESHSTGSDSRGSAKIPESRPKGQKQSPPLITKVPKLAGSQKQNSSELIENRKPNDIIYPLLKPSIASKTVAWNFSDGSTSSVETPRTGNENSDLGSVGFNANVDTIKRSPYKQKGPVDSEPDSHSTPQSASLIAWDEKPSKVDGEQVIRPSNGSSAFTKNSDSNLLKDFEPLLTTNDKASVIEATNNGNYLVYFRW